MTKISKTKEMDTLNGVLAIGIQGAIFSVSNVLFRAKSILSEKMQSQAPHWH